jgi:dihydropteroate synthase
MGILNLTPDSFFDGGRFNSQDMALQQAEAMLEQGATILDLGGMSSRPGAEIISAEKELRRLLPNLKAIRNAFPDACISVDTIRAEVAEAAIGEGADLINDISAGMLDEAMFDTIARLQVPYVIMHMRGTPKTMHKQTDYEDVVVEVLDFLIQRAGKLRDLGVGDIILDPGFGFGKTIEQNYRLLGNLHTFRLTDFPVLAGLSRKSMIGKVIGTSPAESLNGTTALHMVALQQGASILRVHDVREAVQVVRLWEALGSPLFSSADQELYENPT